MNTHNLRGHSEDRRCTGHPVGYMLSTRWRRRCRWTDVRFCAKCTQCLCEWSDSSSCITWPVLYYRFQIGS